jgi:long-chain acyl-CoA synthetase
VNFLENIFSNLERGAGRAVLQEARASGVAAATGSELRAEIETARKFLRGAGLQEGDRCALLAHNSIRWSAVNLALVAEGVIVVPLYARQATRELVGMMRDAGPKLICAGDAALADAVRAEWKDAPKIAVFEEIFAESAHGETQGVTKISASLADGDAVAIIYTSGTSGEPKGVVLTAGNLSFMVARTTERLNDLMREHSGIERVFHYAPFCFAGSWILMLSCLSRTSLLTLSMDLSRLQLEMEVAAPHYFQNVPTLLERVRRGVEDGLAKRGGPVAKIFARAWAAWLAKQNGEAARGGMCLGLARIAVFPAIRKRIGANLRALICGSAPLARDTQLFFIMLGIPVLQVYGLTETTGICTMDIPGRVEPGWVGPAVPGVEMKLGDNQEILVRGPNVFPGYWSRPEETGKALRDGWFHSGDQGEVNANGNWRIVGRIKNLLILNSGHNVAPEPIEEKLLAVMTGAQQVVLVGHGRSYLVAIVTGDVARDSVAAAIEGVNQEMPHYKRIHGFHVERQAFTIDSGLLTALGKLKRDAIGARYAAEIEMIYRENSA